MRVSEACKVRQISIIDVSTPLIVPSFSSRGFTEFKHIYTSVKDYISDVSLLSAYDIYYEMQETNLYASDIIFIDSGGYETQRINLTAASDDIYATRDSSSIRPWSIELYRSVLDNLQSLSQLVLISYDDCNKHQLILDQIETTKSFFQKYPDFASDFLCKPETPESKLINIDNLLKYNHHLTSFSVLGITEKELGNSILERCINLIKIRSILQQENIEIPIHILGCLNPVLMISYFLCGADIFDGLAWLRYVFFDGLTLYQPTATVMQEKWHYSEQDLNLIYSTTNLQYLRHLSHAMKKYCNTKLIQEFSEWKSIIPQVIKLVKKAGLVIED